MQGVVCQPPASLEDGSLRYLHLAGTGVAALLLFTSGSSISAQQNGTYNATKVAAEAFRSRCSTCHAENGEGSEVGATLGVANLRSVRVQRENDSVIRHTITEGKGNMPAFGHDFNEAEVNELIKLVRGFAKK